MVRWHILRTLLYKEYLRYHYNWGLLIVVGALLALAALVSLGARSRLLGGGEEIQTCFILYREGSPAADWARALQKNPPEACALQLRASGTRQDRSPPSLRPDVVAIELLPPAGGDDTWTARFWYPGAAPAAALPLHEWFVHASGDFLQTRPRLREETGIANQAGVANPAEVVPMIVTALAIFALYLLSFNLYITSTGEEREKRILLGLLLTPASPVEMIVAKMIFYAAASVAVALAVVGMNQPHLLLNPFLIGAILCGSISYVAIGTVVISVVRRQTTINTISMLYLIATSIIMILSQVMPLFTLLQMFLVENYLHSLLKLIIGAQSEEALFGRAPSPRLMYGFMVMLAGCTLVWTVIAIWVFARRATSIARAR